MKTIFSLRKKINSNLFATSYPSLGSNLMLKYSKFNFARKSIYSNKQSLNSHNKESNDPEDILNEDFYENKNFKMNNNNNNNNNKNIGFQDEGSIEYKINTMKNLDKSLKRRSYEDRPSLNVNKNKDFLKHIDQNELKKEERRINKILKKLDSPEFDEYLLEKNPKGFDEQEILNELFAGKNPSKNVSFADLENLMSLDDKDNKKAKKSGKGKGKKKENIIDVEALDENEDSSEFNRRLSMLQKEIEKRKRPEDDIGPERYEYVNLKIDEKEGLKIENKLNPAEIRDQSAKLNKTRNVDQNNEFIDVKKANRKFLSKDQIIKQEEKEVGFREDIHKEKIVDLEDESSYFEKEFFESFKKGPNHKSDFLNEKNTQAEEDIQTRSSKKNKKKKPKSATEDEFGEEEGPVDFQKLRNLRKLKSGKSSEKSQDESEFAEREKKNLLNLMQQSRQMNPDNPNISSLKAFEEENEKGKRPKLNIPTDHELVLNDEDSNKSLKDLVERDLNPNLKEHEKALQIEQDLVRLSKISDKNIIDLKPAKDYYLKKKALNLARVWQMDVAETKHWYRRLKREEKQIIKALVQRKKFEQKKKLKKIAKQWKIENDDIVEVNYLEKEREKEEEFIKKAKGEENEKTGEKGTVAPKDAADDDVSIPEHYKNLSEFLFFGDDKDYLRHYKRTCKNIHEFFTRFFSQENQTIKKGIGRNYDIAVSEIRMNRACTVVFVWYEVPKLDMEIAQQREKDEAVNYQSNQQSKEDDNSLDELISKMMDGGPKNLNELQEIKKSDKLINLENIYKKVELNINKAIPYLKAILTKDIGLKYAPDIRFMRDNFTNEFALFEENLQKMNHPSEQENANKLIDFFILQPEHKQFLCALYYLIHENKEYLLSYFEQIQAGELDINTLFPLTEDNTKNVAYETLLDFSDLITSETYDPNDFLLKLIRVVGYKRDKLESYIERLKEWISFTEEELENYFKLASEKKKVKTLEGINRDNKPLKKYLKKNKITYDELQKLKENVNKKEAMNTFLMNFDYKVPGVKSHVISFSEMDEQGKKNEIKQSRIEKEIRNVSRKEYKKVKEIAKGGKSKAQKFWDDLEKNYK